MNKEIDVLDVSDIETFNEGLQMSKSSSCSSSMASELDEAASKGSSRRPNSKSAVTEPAVTEPADSKPMTAMRLALGKKSIKKLDFLTKFVREFRYI